MRDVIDCPLRARRCGEMDQRPRHQHRHDDAAQALAQQSAPAATHDQPGGEVAGDDEKQRHAHEVQEPDDRIDPWRLRAIRGRPEAVHHRAVGERGMEQHAGQHRQRTQVVERGDARVRRRGRCGAGVEVAHRRAQ